MKERDSTICKNCNNIVKGNFCSSCGQSAKTGRINLHYLWHEIQHSIFHVDKGIFYTLKELTLRPGITIEGYLTGKRVNHFKPLAFVIILGTIYGFIAHFTNLFPEQSIIPDFGNNETNTPESLEYGRKFVEIVYSHYSLSMLLLVPFLSLSSFLIFKKSGYNYWEHLIIYSYIVGMQVVIMIILFFLYYFVRSPWVLFASSIITYLYNIWVFVQLFAKESKLKTIAKTIISFIFALTVLLIVIFIVTFIVVFFIQVFHIG